MHVVTPTIRSTPMSFPGAEVWLKLDAVQPSGSFKLRGVGRACQEAVAGGATALVTSSGGNAGLATAVAGRVLGVPVWVIVPRTTSEKMRRKLAAEGAEVRVEGAVWDEAHAAATALAAAVGGALIHPFEGEALWAGHATMIAEAAAQAPRPDVVVCAVGGGGLLCGVAAGLADQGWDDVPIVAAETDGAASYAAALAAGAPVDTPITSIATSLGARRVSARAVAWAKARPVVSALCTDAEALDACARFRDDHRICVEPACGAALAIVYRQDPPIRGVVWAIVCGGANV